jgi:hypothetical protein
VSEGSAPDERLRFVKHKGHAIFVIDFSHCGEMEMLLLLDQVRIIVARHAPGSVLTLADFTGGLKIGVGFLREDSRLAFHEGAANFAPMFEEINQVPEIAPKIRLCVSSGRSVGSLLGPDLGPVTTPDYGLFFATSDLLAHDLLSYSWVKWNREYMTSPEDHIKDGILTRARAERNKGFLKTNWKLPDGHVTPDLVFFQAGTTGGIYDHPAIVNFMKRKGGRPEAVNFEQLTKNPVQAVSNYLIREMKV